MATPCRIAGGAGSSQGRVNVATAARIQIETGAEAILVSSIYGHGEIDCQGFRGRCIERGIGEILLYIGGNLVVGKREFSTVEALFQDMGFDRVFKPSVDLVEVADLLKSDIRKKSPATTVQTERIAQRLAG